MLEAHIRLRFEARSADSTWVTAGGDYVVARGTEVERPGTPEVQTLMDMVAFASGQRGSFPAGDIWPAIDCTSTGKLERDLLSILGS
jgi:hypothetical protein